MRLLFDQYLAYGTVRLSKVKGFESACEVSFVRIVIAFAKIIVAA